MELNPLVFLFFFHFFCDVFHVLPCLFIFPSTQFCLTFFTFLRRCNKFRNRENGRDEGHKEKTLIRTLYARNGGVFHLLDPQYLCTSLFCSFLPLALFIYFYFIVSSLLSFPSSISLYLPFSPLSLSLILPTLLPSSFFTLCYSPFTSSASLSSYRR